MADPISLNEKRPVALTAHDWQNRTKFESEIRLHMWTRIIVIICHTLHFGFF